MSSSCSYFKSLSSGEGFRVRFQSPKAQSSIRLKEWSSKSLSPGEVGVAFDFRTVGRCREVQSPKVQSSIRLQDGRPQPPRVFKSLSPGEGFRVRFQSPKAQSSIRLKEWSSKSLSPGEGFRVRFQDPKVRSRVRL